MRTKVAEFWKLPDALSAATRVECYRKVPDGEGEWRWSHLVKRENELIALLVYDKERVR